MMGLVAGVGVWVAVRLFGGEGRRAGAWGLAVLFGLAVATMVVGVRERSGHTWNSVRTVLPVAMGRGEQIYFGQGQGPMWCQIYPPVGIAAYVPAALATTPSGAIAIGQWLSVVYLIGAGALAGFLVGRRWESAVAGAAVLAAGAAALQPLADVALMVHVDAPAIGLVLVACGLVARREDAGSTRRVLLAGALAAAAVFCKQTTVLLPAALAGWVWLHAGRGAAGRLIAGWVVTVVTLGAASVGVFGLRELTYNLWTLPSRQGFGATAGEALLLIARGGAWYVLVPLGLVIAALTREGGRWRDRPAVLFALAAAAMYPPAMAAYAKVGGDVNNFAYVIAPLLLGLAASAGRADTPAWLARGVTGLAALCMAWHLLTTKLPTAATNQHDRAYALLRDRPGTVYFPWLPLSHYLGERRLTHQSWGISDRLIAGEKLTSDHLGRYLPPEAIFTAQVDEPTPLDGAREVLRESFPTRVQVPGLEGWWVYGQGVR